MRPAHKALAAVTAAVVGYNIAAADGETISEGVDALLELHPVLTRATITLLALHLANAIAAQADPLHLAFQLARRRRRLVVVVESEPMRTR